MASFLKKFAKIILGIDDTELPVAQYNYLKDVSENGKSTRVNEENMYLFIESLKEKHDLTNISLFRRGIPIFSSDIDNLEKTTKLHDLYNSNKKHINDKMIMLKDKNWVTIYERDEFVFVVKRDSRLNEFEMNAISFDVLKNLDNVLIVEKNMIDNLYNNNKVN